MNPCQSVNWFGAWEWEGWLHGTGMGIVRVRILGTGRRETFGKKKLGGVTFKKRRFNGRVPFSFLDRTD